MCFFWSSMFVGFEENQQQNTSSLWISLDSYQNQALKQIYSRQQSSLKTIIFQTTKHIYSEWERNIFQRIKQIFLGHESKYIPDKKAKIFLRGETGHKQLLLLFPHNIGRATLRLHPGHFKSYSIQIYVWFIYLCPYLHIIWIYVLWLHMYFVSVFVFARNC